MSRSSEFVHILGKRQLWNRRLSWLPPTCRYSSQRAERTLTLITCFPIEVVGPAPDRLIVCAREREGPR